jgi:putative transposase
VYFFTLATHQRKPLLCEQPALARLKAAFRYAKQKLPFQITGLVILPDHIHSIWQLPDDDADFSTRWNMIKRYFSIGINGNINHRREKDIWQKRFWEHMIRDEEELQRCLDYIHYNPVKHGYTDRPCDWPHSTFKNHVKKGFYAMDWGTNIEPNKIRKLELE